VVGVYLVLLCLCV